MNKRFLTFATLLLALLTSCDPVSLSSLYYTPRSLPIAAVRRPLDKTAKQFSLEPRIDPTHLDRLAYFDAPRAARPHLGVTAEISDGRIVIMEMFTFSPSPRMLAYEQALIANFAAVGVSVSRNALPGTRAKSKSEQAVAPNRSLAPSQNPTFRVRGSED